MFFQCRFRYQVLHERLLFFQAIRLECDGPRKEDIVFLMDVLMGDVNKRVHQQVQLEQGVLIPLALDQLEQLQVLPNQMRIQILVQLEQLLDHLNQMRMKQTL